MNKRNTVTYILLIFVTCILVACSNNPIIYTNQNGKISSDNKNNIIKEYKINSSDGFFVLLNFSIKKGKIEWMIKNPNGNMIFKGYVENVNGKSYKQLIYPTYYMGGELNRKEINSSDFEYLQIEPHNALGNYELIITPTNAIGDYNVQWSNKLSKK